MRSENEHTDLTSSSTYRELRLLSEIETDPEVTQRQLSHRVGIALGLTNILLRNLAQKGYLRATQTSWKRWLYSVTPEGFTHKVRLTVGYIRRVMNHYSEVRQTLREQLAPLALHEESRIAMYGTGEFAELVYLGLKEIGIEEIEMFGPKNLVGQRFLGMTVHDLATLDSGQYDRVVVALLGKSDPGYDELSTHCVTSDKLVTFFADGDVEWEE